MLFEKQISSYNPNTPDKNCEKMFLVEKPHINGFLKHIDIQN